MRALFWIALSSLSLLGCGELAPDAARSTREKPALQGRVEQKEIPAYARDVLREIRKTGRAPEGFEGGRHFGNFERRLPERDSAGRRIEYREWDVKPRVPGVNRGPERLVTSDESAWYTRDHYRSFIRIQEDAHGSR